MQYFGRKNLAPSIFTNEQILALRFNILNAQTKLNKTQTLPTQNAISSMFNNAQIQNGFKI